MVIYKDLLKWLGQNYCYKIISKQSDIPVTTVANVIKKTKIHGTIAPVPERGCRRKIEPRLDRSTVEIVEKELKKTSK